MAEVTKTIENVDTLFSQIVVNGTVYNSENYVAPETETTTEESTEETNTEEQTDDTTEAEENEEVYAVDLNDVVHNIKDDTARNSVEDINKLIPSNASEINKLVTQNSINLISSNITELQSALEAEVTARENADSTLQLNIEAEATARENADSALESDLDDEITARENADTAINSSISTINAKIPNQASAQNQLADKDFVNSSISTNTANFLGTYSSMAEIEAIQNPTNNDYVFLVTTDSAGNTKYDRYKYNADQDEWLFEYELNNSSFTAEQWATINSGLTQSLVNTAISNAINALDVASVGGSGKYISAISETDGKISATATTMDTTPTQNSNKAVTSGGVYNAIAGASGDVSSKMDKNNPTGTGSFSLNRKANTTVGQYSFAEGLNTTASGDYSHAEGNTTTASGDMSHAEGGSTTASGVASHAEGHSTTASGYESHAEGLGTKASSSYQHVQGKYNVEDTASAFVDIVGGGTRDDSRANLEATTSAGDKMLKGEVFTLCSDNSKGGVKVPPVGSIMMFAGSSAPSGWLLCQGQSVRRTIYADLFTAIGTTYGTGDGSTTFNLPDLRETVPVGVGTRASGVTEHDTYSLGTFKDDQFQGHEHNYQKHTGSAKANWNNSYNITNFSNTPTSDIVEKSGYGAPRYGTTTHGKQLGLNFIIKY